MGNVLSDRTVLFAAISVVFITTGLAMIAQLLDSTALGLFTLGTFIGSLVSTGVIFIFHKRCKGHYLMIQAQCRPMNWVYGVVIVFSLMSAFFHFPVELARLIFSAAINALMINSILFIFPLILWGRFFGDLQRR